MPGQKSLASYIDHTLLKPEATEQDIKKLCEEAIEYQFATVCIHPHWVGKAKKWLKKSGVGITTVIGFPLGVTTATVKAYETHIVLAEGADEVDMVINVGALKSGLLEIVRNDIAAVVTANKNRAVVKVIIETSQLSDKEKVTACQLAVEAGADYVKTSTGFHTGGATLTDIEIMKEAVAGKAKVKASGGIKTAQTALEYIEAGVERIGTSSGVAIMNDEEHQ